MNSSFLRRGRPPTSSLPQKVMEGMASDSQLKCEYCSRVFPRPKSLRAHQNLHTGKTPYVCDYPGCDKAFKQSGHLRSHTFRHTGEKPFKCPSAGCGERFIHANRHCPVHDPLKFIKLIRDGQEFIDVNEANLSEEQREWLQRYKNRKYNPRGTKRPVDNDSDEENIPANKDRTSAFEDDGFNSAGSESPSSSPSYKTDEANSAGSESSSSPIHKNGQYTESESSSSELDEGGLKAAYFLARWKDRLFD